jgi:heptosyltransferase-2
MKILIRLPNWLGDLVMSTAFIDAAQHQYPNAEIHAIVKKELKDIAGLIPAIHTVHPFSKNEFKGLSGVYSFGKSLRKKKFDLFISLTDSFSSALMGWASKSKVRLGYHKEGRGFLLTEAYKKPSNLHRVDEYLVLLERFTGKTISTNGVKIPVLADHTDKKELILINFNSEAESRRMPVEKGRKIISLLIQNFPENRFGFIGSSKETAFVRQLIEGFPTQQVLDYSGKTNLLELASLMAKSCLIISTDSGPAHLANSIGTPTIALFGAGNEKNTSPYNTDFLKLIRAGQLICEPCVRNSCKLYGIPKCLELIEENRIIESIKIFKNHAQGRS